MKGSKRHDFIYKFARLLLTRHYKKKLSYDFDFINPKHKPYIVIPNHVSVYDAMIVGMLFKDSMYYVASDHLFRMGLIGKLLHWAVAPIPRAKSTTDTKTVIEIFRRLKEGHNICIFAEGNSTFSGETGYIPPSIGKLIKRSGASLITVKFTDGYLTLPRWSHNIRKGKMHCSMVHEYLPDELKTMTDEQIGDQISKDLYVNAFDDQKARMIKHKAPKLAEHLEYCIYICPSCKSIATLRSENDRFFCSCGLDLKLNEFGFFEYTNPGNAPSELLFETILDWYKWQKEYMKIIVSEFLVSNETDSVLRSTPIFTDSQQILLSTRRATRTLPVLEGVSKFYYDRIEISNSDGGNRVFFLSEISNMSVIIQMNLIFTYSDGITYELRSYIPRSALKYIDFYRYITKTPESV